MKNNLNNYEAFRNFENNFFFEKEYAMVLPL